MSSCRLTHIPLLGVMEGRARVGMAHQFLDMSEVSAIVERPGGEGPAQHMRAKPFAESTTFTQAPEHLRYGVFCDGLAFFSKEECPSNTRAPDRRVLKECDMKGIAEWQKAFLLSFAFADMDDMFVPFHIVFLKTHEFLKPWAGIQ